LRRRRDEINRVASRHGAGTVRVFGSIARGDARPDSDLDLLIGMERRSLFNQAALQGRDHSLPPARPQSRFRFSIKPPGC
jgi:predicted nucleotidyltransferase